MVDLKLFKTRTKKAAMARNEAGGKAYELSAEQSLAQYAATGCLGGTFYADARDQLDAVQRLAAKVDDTFLYKVSIYARERAKMKDMPAFLLAVLSSRNSLLFKQAFPRVIDNSRLLRIFVQIVRSGASGRRSLGTTIKRQVQNWLTKRDPDALLNASVGSQPSLADIIKMVHPKPVNDEQAAMFAWLIGKKVKATSLPERVQAFDRAKQKLGKELPDLPYPLLSGLPLQNRHWRSIAETASWQVTRMSLASFQRHEVFDNADVTESVARRLRNPRAIDRAKAMPFQLLRAYEKTLGQVPMAISEALQDAMELAIKNVPRLSGDVALGIDISGSMWSPVSGQRDSATSAVSCLHVASLFAAALLRRNREAQVLPFHDRYAPCRLNPRDSVMTNARKLMELPSGGTNCSIPLKELNRRKAMVDVVILLSDNESWIDTSANRGYYGRYATEVVHEWRTLKYRCPKAKLICLDMQPYGTVQAPAGLDILHIGGFSDAVFATIGAFARQTDDPDFWVHEINKVA
jgi:60 kDa SS-A/Ro ribonucleoprotein